MKALAEAPVDATATETMQHVGEFVDLPIQPDAAANAILITAARRTRAGRRAGSRAVQGAEDVVIIEAAQAEPRIIEPALQQAVGDLVLRAPDEPASASTVEPMIAEQESAAEEPDDTEEPETPLPEVPVADVNEPGPVVTILDFEDIFTRFQTPLINFVYRLVGNREQACDLVQDVFVKAFRAFNGGTIIQAGALSSWLYRIASNTATDALRRRRLINWLPLSLFNEDRGVGAGMPGDVPTDQYADTQAYDNVISSGSMGNYDGGRFENRIADREIIQSVLSKMPPKYSATLLLYEYEGFTVAETAEVLKISPSAVKMRLMRARENFITRYKAETGDHLSQFFQPRRGKQKGEPSALRVAIQL